MKVTLVINFSQSVLDAHKMTIEDVRKMASEGIVELKNDCPEGVEISMEIEDEKDPFYMMREASNQIMRLVNEQREEILKAFVAKYGFDPARTIQVHTAEGKWLVRQMTDEEYAKFVERKS